MLDRTQFTGQDTREGFHQSGVGSVLKSGLDNPLVIMGRRFHLLAFPHVMANGFFDVDILPGLAGPDCLQGMPVVGCGNDDRIDIASFQETFVNAFRINRLAVGLLNVLRCLGQNGGVDIAYRDQPCCRHIGNRCLRQLRAIGHRQSEF